MWLAEDHAGAGVLAAKLVSDIASKATAGGRKAHIAFSGGNTPIAMLAALRADIEMPWRHLDVWQVDERVAPNGHRDRNHTQLLHQLRGRLTATNFHPMAVGNLDDSEDDGLMTAAYGYSVALRRMAGRPPVLDVAHLGLGSDGHTASLLPGDETLEVERLDVAVSRRHQGRRRLTLTVPVLRSARRQVWLITGGTKADMVRRVIAADTDIPAGRVVVERADLVLDPDAAALVPKRLLRGAHGAESLRERLV